jgi:predicted aspartyl protease
MPLIEGPIDHLGRAIVSVDISGSETPLRCQIDTGFNRCLLLSRAMALEYKFQPRSPQIVSRIRTASTDRVASELWTAELVWLSERFNVDANIVLHDPIGGAGDDRPHALLGVELLRGLHVFFDFQFNRFTVQTPVR